MGHKTSSKYSDALRVSMIAIRWVQIPKEMTPQTIRYLTVKRGIVRLLSWTSVDTWLWSSGISIIFQSTFRPLVSLSIVTSLIIIELGAVKDDFIIAPSSLSAISIGQYFFTLCWAFLPSGPCVELRFTYSCQHRGMAKPFWPEGQAIFQLDNLTSFKPPASDLLNFHSVREHVFQAFVLLNEVNRIKCVCTLT